MTNISLLHVSAPGFHPQKFFQVERIQASPSLKLLKF